MNSYNKGKWAEFLARIYLNFHGYHCVYCNYITGKGTTAGEVDLIMRKGKTLAFIEVKLRKDLYSAAYAIKETQKQRILHGALSFMKRYPQYQEYDMRFDAVLVCLPFSIYHLKNAWTA